jgi:hypothetical protein
MPLADTKTIAAMISVAIAESVTIRRPCECFHPRQNFTVPKFAFAPPPEGNSVYELMTMRADGQFNTTIYNEDDRFRGIQGLAPLLSGLLAQYSPWPLHLSFVVRGSTTTRGSVMPSNGLIPINLEISIGGCSSRFPRPLPARERKWKTPNGKAKGGRYVVFMNLADMEEEGLEEGDTVTLSTAVGDGVERTLSELQVVAYDIPRKSLSGYYPECNGLIPLWHYA